MPSGNGIADLGLTWDPLFDIALPHGTGVLFYWEALGRYVRHGLSPTDFLMSRQPEHPMDERRVPASMLQVIYLLRTP